VPVETGKPRVNYCETIKMPAAARGRHKKQTGGHGQFGDVAIEVTPLGRGEGFAFQDKITGGVVPRQYIPSVETGVRDAIRRGPLGFPVVDVAVTLTDGSYHTVDSSDAAFQAAARLALAEALPKAKPVLLEPVLSVEIAIPTEALSKATALVTGRRGQILGYDGRPGWQGWDVLKAMIPESEIGDLIVELRSATAGVGTFSTRFDHMAELTGRSAEQVCRVSPREPGISKLPPWPKGGWHPKGDGWDESSIWAGSCFHPTRPLRVHPPLSGEGCGAPSTKPPPHPYFAGKRGVDRG
jgi:elongation factor G